MKTRILLCLLAALTFPAPAAFAQVTKAQVAGVTNFAQVETTVACAGATTPEAMPEVKKLGFASVINLRLPTEPGADIDREAAAANAAGLTFISLPFNGASPDPAVVDRFLEALSRPGTQPAFIHCASGNRAAALWLVKRVKMDGWDVDRAAAEATALGLTSGALKQFALDYLQAHR
jgi:uncharacterized protein (TIGR01244 family)